MQTEEKKKISVFVELHYIRQMEDEGLNQSEGVTEAIKYYFSEDRRKIESYKIQIISDEKKIAISEARLDESEKHRATLAGELSKVHEEYQAHLSQVQSVLRQLEDERRKREGIILRLGDGEKKKVWWKFW